MFKISACGWSLTGEPMEVLRRVRGAGFDAIDLWPTGWRGIAGPEQISDAGLSLACAGVSTVLSPPGTGLNALAGADAGRVLPYFSGAIERAGALGARAVYMVTPDIRLPDDLFYGRAMARLADSAAAAGVRLCVEPHPGRALATSAEALDFVRRVDHENLYVLIDLGHTLITGEDPAAAVRSAGGRLGYVHVDDNDGRDDLHLPLFSGVLTRGVAEGFLDALADANYDGGVGIELKSTNPAPLSALVAAREFTRGWEIRRGV
ncbi:MAG: sugar phosphate isomerase/epimerase [Chloroflexi bacterium]|nr:sugar phosphate isomerase/epimerase [Chloroflexota bacterium]